MEIGPIEPISGMNTSTYNDVEKLHCVKSWGDKHAKQRESKVHDKDEEAHVLHQELEVFEGVLESEDEMTKILLSIFPINLELRCLRPLSEQYQPCIVETQI